MSHSGFLETIGSPLQTEPNPTYMDILKKISIVAFAWLLCGSAYSQVNDGSTQQFCSESTLKLVSKHLGIHNLSFNNQGIASNGNKIPVIASVCKVWPYEKSLTIVSFVYDAGIQDEKRLIVSLADTSKNTVIASYKGAIQEDAAMTVGSGSLNIDTARYNLAPGVRAFGLALSTSYSQGCVDGGLGPTHMLFIKYGKALRPVLEGFYLSTWTFIRGGPSCASGEQEIVIETTSYAIGIGNAVTNGFSDLRITATNSLDNGAKSSRKPFTYALKYDGKAYPIGTFNGAADKIDKWHN